MPIPPEEKHQHLRDAGVVTTDSVPDEYKSVVASLTSDELETLLSVKKRLDLAEQASGTPFGDIFVAP
jgi:hypothetical protein